VTHFDEKPWIRRIEEIGPLSFWEVDGGWIRKYLDKNFTNWAIGLDPRFKAVIPSDEAWVDKGYNPSELPYFIENMLTFWLALKQGYSRQRAEKRAIQVEQRERHRAGEKITKRELLEGKPELKLLHTVPNGEVWLVDGEMVRRPPGGDQRFCNGGHSEVYSYVPDNHIWIDNTLVPKEWPFNIVHEVDEFNNMKMGESYSTAHPKALRKEWKCRHDAEELLRQQKELGLI
jgi:hypothetical protein